MPALSPSGHKEFHMKKARQAAIMAGKALGLSGLALMAYVNQAMAAVPTVVSDAITTAQTDTSTVAGLVVGLIFTVWGIKYLAKGR